MAVAYTETKPYSSPATPAILANSFLHSQSVPSTKDAYHQNSVVKFPFELRSAQVGGKLHYTLETVIRNFHGIWDESFLQQAIPAVPTYFDSSRGHFDFNIFRPHPRQFKFHNPPGLAAINVRRGPP